MTNPAGQSFLSYRRSGSAQARLLLSALHDHGVPTWHDVEDLDDGRTEDEIRKVLGGPDLASGVLLITPDVAESPWIPGVEAPLLFKRALEDDAFFVVPVVTDGLDREQAAALFARRLGLEDLRDWNLITLPGTLGTDDAVAIARRVVERRLAEIHRALPRSEPLRIGLYTWRRPPREQVHALALDWQHHFSGRMAAQESWDQRLLPALEFLSQAISRNCRGREIVAEGPCTLSSAVALGRAFLEPGGIPLTWRQNFQGRGTQSWHLGQAARPCGFEEKLRSGSLEGRDLAVLVSVVEDVEGAVAATKSLSGFRARLELKAPGALPYRLEDAGEAVDLARRVAAGIRRARREYPGIRRTHLFLAGPTGLAVLIGQLLNTLGPVQVHEQLEPDLGGSYAPGVLLEGGTARGPQAASDSTDLDG